jgi:hypothetical protein
MSNTYLEDDSWLSYFKVDEENNLTYILFSSENSSNTKINANQLHEVENMELLFHAPYREIVYYLDNDNRYYFSCNKQIVKGVTLSEYLCLNEKDRGAVIIQVKDSTPPPPQETAMQTETTDSILKTAMTKALSGAKIGASGNIANAIVRIVREGLGETYPKLLSSSPLGNAAEPFIVALTVHFLATHFPGVVPKHESVTAVSELAMEYGGVKFVDAIAQHAEIFEKIGALTSSISTPDTEEKSKN